MVDQATERVHGLFYSDYDVFLIFILSYVSQSALVFTLYGIGGMLKRFIDNTPRTMITSKKELTIISTENQVFAVLVDHFDTNNRWEEDERKQIPFRVMKISTQNWM